MTLPEHQGPPYPDLGAGVAKWRRVAHKAGSIAAMARADVVAYADAMEKAIRAKHRAMHIRPTPSATPNWYRGEPIARLFKYENPHPMVGDPKWKPSDVNADQWAAREKAVYAAAMESKRSVQIAVDMHHGRCNIPKSKRNGVTPNDNRRNHRSPSRRQPHESISR